MMKHGKKLAALTVSLALLATTLAGCGDSGSGAPAPDAGGAGSNAAEHSS